MKNETRIRRAQKAFSAYPGKEIMAPGCINYESGIINLIVDLLHLAHEKDLNIYSIVNMAVGHFEAERTKAGKR